MKLRSALIESNPWWKNPAWDPQLKPRQVLEDIRKVIPLRQIIAISGLRRVGKSSLMHYLIHELNGTEDTLYFSFDDFSSVEIDELLDIYTFLTGKPLPRFLFLDEIQKLENWQEKLKRIYDQKNVKIFISGSESLFIKKRSRESLAGRIFEFTIKQLSFKEYLSFKNIEVSPLYEKEIKRELGHYLFTGGFPELIDVTERKIARDYIYSSIVEKVIFSDIPRLFRIEEPSLLRTIIDIILDNPGMIMDFVSASRELGVSRQTLSNYTFYLESSYLIKRLYNYSPNRSTSEKKSKKFYPTFPALALYYDDSKITNVVESICVLHADAKFFWRSPQKDEVDIVRLREESVEPIEIKYSETHLKHALHKFSKKYGGTRGYVVTKDSEKIEKSEDFEIHYVPLWKWLLST